MIKVPQGGVSTGRFNISFFPFQMTSSSHAGFELRKKREIGPGGRYIRKPASIVTARQFGIVPIDVTQTLNINDDITRDGMTVDWVRKTNRERIDLEEVTFLIIGEVPEARNLTRASGPVSPVRQRPRLRKKKRRSARR
jgi:hypothetical protein